MRTEASFVRPFQVVLELSQAATAKLHAAHLPTYERAPVSVLLDGVLADGTTIARKTFIPRYDVPPQVVNVEVWKLHTECFYLNDWGKAVFEWPGGMCSPLSVRSFDTIRDFFDARELDSLADELIDILISPR